MTGSSMPFHYSPILLDLWISSMMEADWNAMRTATLRNFLVFRSINNYFYYFIGCSAAVVAHLATSATRSWWFSPTAKSPPKNSQANSPTKTLRITQSYAKSKSPTTTSSSSSSRAKRTSGVTLSSCQVKRVSAGVQASRRASGKEYPTS